MKITIERGVDYSSNHYSKASYFMGKYFVTHLCPFYARSGQYVNELYSSTDETNTFNY